MQNKNNSHNDIKLISKPIELKIKTLPTSFIIDPECDFISHYDKSAMGRLNDELERMLGEEVNKSVAELYKKINITNLNENI